MNEDDPLLLKRIRHNLKDVVISKLDKSKLLVSHVYSLSEIRFLNKRNNPHFDSWCETYLSNLGIQYIIKMEGGETDLYMFMDEQMNKMIEVDNGE